MWNDTTLNSVILGAVGAVTLILKRLFSRTDTFYDRLTRDSRQKQEQIDWQRSVMYLMDQEIWEHRRAMEAAGIQLQPRKEWPPSPKSMSSAVVAP